MSAKHTPGPWQWAGNTLEPVNKQPEVSAVYSILDADGGYGFLGSDYKKTLAELDADRQLIAAAPDLLEALRETLLFCETFSNRWDGQTGAHPFGMVERARAAIAKATGSTS